MATAASYGRHSNLQNLLEGKRHSSLKALAATVGALELPGPKRGTGYGGGGLCWSHPPPKPDSPLPSQFQSPQASPCLSLKTHAGPIWLWLWQGNLHVALRPGASGAYTQGATSVLYGMFATSSAENQYQCEEPLGFGCKLSWCWEGEVALMSLPGSHCYHYCQLRKKMSVWSHPCLVAMRTQALQPSLLQTTKFI